MQQQHALPSLSQLSLHRGEAPTGVRYEEQQRKYKWQSILGSQTRQPDAGDDQYVDDALKTFVQRLTRTSATDPDLVESDKQYVLQHCKRLWLEVTLVANRWYLATRMQGLGFTNAVVACMGPSNAAETRYAAVNLLRRMVDTPKNSVIFNVIWMVMTAPSCAAHLVGLLDPSVPSRAIIDAMTLLDWFLDEGYEYQSCEVTIDNDMGGDNKDNPSNYPYREYQQLPWNSLPEDLGDFVQLAVEGRSGEPMATFDASFHAVGGIEAVWGLVNYLTPESLPARAYQETGLQWRCIHLLHNESYSTETLSTLLKHNAVPALLRFLDHEREFAFNQKTLELVFALCQVQPSFDDDKPTRVALKGKHMAQLRSSFLNVVNFWVNKRPPAVELNGPMIKCFQLIAAAARDDEETCRIMAGIHRFVLSLRDFVALEWGQNWRYVSLGALLLARIVTVAPGYSNELGSLAEDGNSALRRALLVISEAKTWPEGGWFALVQAFLVMDHGARSIVYHDVLAQGNRLPALAGWFALVATDGTRKWVDVMPAIRKLAGCGRVYRLYSEYVTNRAGWHPDEGLSTPYDVAWLASLLREPKVLLSVATDPHDKVLGAAFMLVAQMDAADPALAQASGLDSAWWEGAMNKLQEAWGGNEMVWPLLEQSINKSIALTHSPGQPGMEATVQNLMKRARENDDAGGSSSDNKEPKISAVAYHDLFAELERVVLQGTQQP